MNNGTKIVIGIFAAACAMWDAYTTFGGMLEIIGTKGIALIFTIFINGAIFLAFADLKNTAISVIKGIIVFAATICDLYTAYTGNMTLMSTANAGQGSQIFISVVMTIIAVGSSFLVSYLIFGDEKNSR